MQRVVSFFKNNKWLWIVVVVFVAYFGDLSLQKSLQSPSATPKPTPIAKKSTYQNISPGLSTESDLTKTFGDPLRRTAGSGQVELEYRSTSAIKNHYVLIRNGKLAILKETVTPEDNKSAASITSEYGVPQNILYNKLPNSSFQLYVYPENGIAFLGHSDGTIIEVWYFEPTSIEGFVSLWAPDYSNKPAKTNVY